MVAGPVQSVLYEVLEMEDKAKIIVEGKNLSKAFNGNVVLEDVSIQCLAGEGLALAGENGAGKSTLMNIISGSLTPESGSVWIDGRERHFSGFMQARKLGIAFVHQELSLMQEMTVGENIMLGHEPKKYGLIDQAALHKQAAKILEDIGYTVDEYALVRELTPAQKQIVEIAKAWADEPRVLIFDEPTSSLNKAESDKLFEFINRIKKQGVSVIVISHRMDDLFATCERVIVLKDGRFVFSAPMKETSSDEIISKMVGREFKNVYPPRNEVLPETIRVELKNACVGSRVKNINLKIPVGSVIGIGGLEGQGQRELSRALFGIEPFTSGEYLIEGSERRIHSPSAAVKNKIAFVSDDRKAEGLFLPLSCAENIVSLTFHKNSRFGFVDRKAVKTEVESGIEQLHIRLSDSRQEVKSLSGGNQQKIVFSKWVKTKPDVLILHEPTRGIDVQSKLEIYELIRTLTKSGVSVIVFTSDMLELIGISDMIYVMYEGRISGCIKGAEATEEKIMKLSASSGKEEPV